MQADGKIVIAGEFTSFNGVPRRSVARLNADGSVDASFDPNMGGAVRALALQSDGKVLLGGDFVSVGDQPIRNIARLNADGSLDLSFDPRAGANFQVWSVASQTDGKVLLGGYFTEVQGAPAPHLARLNANGSLDSTFNIGSGPDQGVQAIAVQSRDRVLVAGDFTAFNGVPRGHIARLAKDGTLDMRFDPGSGADDVIYSSALQADGRVWIGGFFTNVDQRPRLGVARLLNGAEAAAGALEFAVADLQVPEASNTNVILKVRRVGGTNGLVQVN